MKSRLRHPHLDEVLQKNMPSGKRREFVIDPEGGFFDAKSLAAAIRKAGAGDIIHVPPGEYPAFELKKNLEIRALSPGNTLIKGEVHIAAEFVLLAGLEFRSERDRDAIKVEKGTLVLDDCVVHGTLRAGSPGGKTRLFLKNCLAGNALEGIVLEHQAAAEISSSRIARCQVGLALHPGASCAVYHSRLEACLSQDANDPGAAIFADSASLYCEGTTFMDNGVGVYLKNCGTPTLLSSHFCGSKTAAVIALDGPPDGPLHVRSCLMERQTSTHCAQAMLTGGAAEMVHCAIQASAATALSADQTRLDLHQCHLSSLENPALDLRTCQGLVHHCLLTGHPPDSVAASPQVKIEASERRETALSPTVPNDEPAPSTMESVLRELKLAVSQESVRSELERILRLAHAAQERRSKGLPVPEQSFHCIFMGPAGTGKRAAAEVLARGLHAFGIVSRPELVPVSSSNTNELSSSAQGGLVFLRARDVEDSLPTKGTLQSLLAHHTSQPGTIVVLEGDRDEIRRLLRSQPGLDRAFRKTLFFTNYGPVELAAHLARLCAADHIPLSPDAARDLLLTLHLYSERKDKRFANTKGVEFLYEAARRRYLERCSVAMRFDLELETRDFDIPQDKSLRAAIERCPAFISVCPSCHQENPWLPGLEHRTHCLHCDAPYTADWGIWKDSTTYRRLREAETHPLENTLAARRIHLPYR